MFLVGRVIMGVGGGCYAVFINSMLNDIAPLEYKGPIGVCFQLFLTLGILISNIIGLPFLITPKDEDKPLSLNCNNKIPTYIHTYTGNNFFKFYYFRIFFAIPAIIALI